jgi:hypothetical protein
LHPLERHKLRAASKHRVPGAEVQQRRTEPVGIHFRKRAMVIG